MGTAPFLAMRVTGGVPPDRVSRSVSGDAQQGPGPLHHVLGGDAELLHDQRAGGRGAEVVEADGVVGVAVPTEGGAGLNAEHGYAGREDGGPVVVGLALEVVPGR